MNLEQMLQEALGEPKQVSKARQADAMATQLILVKENDVADAVEIALQTAVVLMLNFRKNTLEQSMRSLHPLTLMAIVDHLDLLHNSQHEQAEADKAMDSDHTKHRREVLGVTGPETILNASYTGRMMAMFSREAPQPLTHADLVSVHKIFAEELAEHAKAHVESKAAKEGNNVH